MSTNIRILNDNNKVRDWRKISADIIDSLKNDVALKSEALKDISGTFFPYESKVYVTGYEQYNAGNVEAWHMPWNGPINLKSYNNYKYSEYDEELGQNVEKVYEGNYLSTFTLKGPNYKYFKFDLKLYSFDDDEQFLGYDTPPITRVSCNNNLYSGLTYMSIIDTNSTLEDSTTNVGDTYLIPYVYYVPDEEGEEDESYTPPYTLYFYLKLTSKNETDTIRTYDLYGIYVSENLSPYIKLDLTYADDSTETKYIDMSSMSGLIESGEINPYIEIKEIPNTVNCVIGLGYYDNISDDLYEQVENGDITISFSDLQTSMIGLDLNDDQYIRLTVTLEDGSTYQYIEVIHDFLNFVRTVNTELEFVDTSNNYSTITFVVSETSDTEFTISLVPGEKLFLCFDQYDKTKRVDLSSLIKSECVKSVKVEIEDGSTTTEELIEETIDTSNYFSLGIFDSYWNSLTPHLDEDDVSEFSTNETLNVGQFTVPSDLTGVMISIYWRDNNSEHGYNVLPNGTYNFGGDSVIISNSPYADDSNNPGIGLISVSELPSVGQSKIFYPTHFGESDNQTNITTNTEYTGTDVKFTITNIDGTNYTLSFIWEKTDTVTVTTKSLKTTLTRNDDSEEVTTSPISGLLQDVDVSFEQILAETTSGEILSNIYSHISIITFEEDV